MLRRLYRRTLVGIGYGIGCLVCEPQLRLGRRRHDGHCDVCGEAFGRYAMEKLVFPEGTGETTSTLDRLRAMTNAEYVRICLECDADE